MTVSVFLSNAKFASSLDGLLNSAGSMFEKIKPVAGVFPELEIFTVNSTLSPGLAWDGSAEKLNWIGESIFTTGLADRESYVSRSKREDSSRLSTCVRRLASFAETDMGRLSRS